MRGAFEGELPSLSWGIDLALFQGWQGVRVSIEEVRQNDTGIRSTGAVVSCLEGQRATRALLKRITTDIASLHDD